MKTQAQLTEDNTALAKTLAELRDDYAKLYAAWHKRTEGESFGWGILPFLQANRALVVHAGIEPADLPKLPEFPESN